MDLLLYLIRKNEVDIRDIPVGKITDQYMAYLEKMRGTDLDFSGEFLVMAATLLEIKARMLLPAEALPEEEEDPRAELVRQLMEYRAFKERAAGLSELKAIQDRRYPRGMRFERGEEGEDGEALKDVELWDLVSAFSRVLEQTHVVMPETMREDDVPVSGYMERVIERLGESTGEMAFEDAFRGSRTRLQLIGIFLAILELARLRRIKVFQGEFFGSIRLQLREEEPGEPPKGPAQTAEAEAESLEGSETPSASPEPLGPADEEGEDSEPDESVFKEIDDLLDRQDLGPSRGPTRADEPEETP